MYSMKQNQYLLSTSEDIVFPNHCQEHIKTWLHVFFLDYMFVGGIHEHCRLWWGKEEGGFTCCHVGLSDNWITLKSIGFAIFWVLHEWAIWRHFFFSPIFNHTYVCWPSLHENLMRLMVCDIGLPPLKCNKVSAFGVDKTIDCLTQGLPESSSHCEILWISMWDSCLWHICNMLSWNTAPADRNVDERRRDRSCWSEMR